MLNKKKLEKLGIESITETRWEKGIPHHKKSIELLDAMRAVDVLNGGTHSYETLETGGDGDTGEELMYLMDVWFEYRDIIDGNQYPNKAL